jgi:hypothetical protein
LHGLISDAGLTVAEGVGFEAATATPLFQTNFFPDLMHVNFLPDETEVIPALLHLAPALAAAFTGIMGVDRKRESIEKNAISFLFMSKAYEIIKLLQKGIRPYLT